MSRRPPLPILVALLSLVAACGGSGDGEAVGTSTDRPTIAVTTDVLGDVVGLLLGAEADVLVVMPPGADPHTFEASAGAVNDLLAADAVVANGADLELGLAPTLALVDAEGVPVLRAVDHIDQLTLDHDHAHDHSEDDDDHVEGPDDGAADPDDPGHAHGDVDPHFSTDPARVVQAAEGLAAALAREVPTLATAEARAAVDAGLAELRAAAADVADVLGAVAPDDRVLLTEHDGLRYLADTHGFEVEVVVPGTDATEAEVDAFVHAVDEAEVPAVFVDVSAVEDVGPAVAAAVGDAVEVVGLHTEALGGPGSGAETYLDRARSSAERIARALG